MHNKSPNLFIVGAPKAGSSFLFEKIKNHPEIFHTETKELNYFSYSELEAESYYRDFRIKSLTKYESLYAKVKNQSYAIDASVSYFAYSDVPKRIFNYNSEAKILIVLRNPVKRAFSHYLMDCRMGYADQSFREYITNPEKYKPHYVQYIGNSSYAENVQRYIDVFGADKVLILKLENLQSNISNVFEFLNIEPIPIDISEKVNENKEPKNGIARFFQKNRMITEPLKKIIPSSFIKLANSKIYKPAQKIEMTPDEKRLTEDILKEDLQYFNNLS